MNTQDPLIGQKFNRLTAKSFSGHYRFPSGKTARMYNCVCDCGALVVVRAEYLRNGHTKSCGCFQREMRALTHLKHGHCRIGDVSVFYAAWSRIKQRCSDPNTIGWKTYGGRGIKVLWTCFEDFLRDMQPTWKSGLTIDRKDNDYHYCKENCRWITQAEQARNTSRNVYLEFQGKRMTKSDWADSLGMNRATLDGRLWAGWSVQESLTTPVNTRPRK